MEELVEGYELSLFDCGATAADRRQFFVGGAHDGDAAREVVAQRFARELSFSTVFDFAYFFKLFNHCRRE